MIEHLCHARNCNQPVPPSKFMCGFHWRMLPQRMKDAIWDAYVPGQEIRKDPNAIYLEAANDAILWTVAQDKIRENKRNKEKKGYTG